MQTIRSETNAPTAVKFESSSGILEPKEKPSSPVWLVSGAIVVLVAYSLPFLINHPRHGPFLNVAVEDEKIYLARVVDVYRGGSLGNMVGFTNKETGGRVPPGLVTGGS